MPKLQQNQNELNVVFRGLIRNPDNLALIAF